MMEGEDIEEGIEDEAVVEAEMTEEAEEHEKVTISHHALTGSRGCSSSWEGGILIITPRWVANPLGTPCFAAEEVSRGGSDTKYDPSKNWSRRTTPRFPSSCVRKEDNKRNNGVVIQWLVQWSNSNPVDATWMDASMLAS
ncbi:hypothetical protein LWI28_003200 [Acer negundo]|uniref:Chromo domain-containing protein n=1 Tax=Acer negundo TaxID=4023 RepID=A0AAD5IXA2_ACENE|nr:hypothetical protein LWI28_003200 [Acer negundo]